VSSPQSLESLRALLPLIVPLALIQLAIQVWALVDLVRRERVAKLPKWLWAVVILCLNLLGPIIYFLLGRED
jgi:sorbitol-specific phosphotransferase system component IIC